MLNVIPIAAVSENGVIGRGKEKLLWRLSEDFAHFKKATSGENKILVFGRSTAEIVGLLPEREIVVMSRDKKYKHPGKCITLHSPKDVLKIFPKHQIYIGGGEEIYKVFLPYACKMIITHVKAHVEGDKFFPEITNEWKKRVIREVEADPKNDFSFQIVEYTRRPRI